MPDGRSEGQEIDFGPFFHPRQMAVVGASATQGRPGTSMFRILRAWCEQHDASLFPVNPRYAELDGVKCYPSLDEVPEGLDVVVVLIDNPSKVVEQAISRKARFVLIFAAGFGELGEAGRQEEARLGQLARAHGAHLIGPNTNLNAFQPIRQDLAGPRIALITQSGHQGRPVYQGQQMGIAMEAWAPTGNEADIDSADFIRYFSGLPKVGAIAAYIEGFRDGRSLQLAADVAIQRGVPLVMVKVGRSAAGRSWAQSHTGHLAGADRVVNGVFKQYGIIRVDGLDELLDTSMLLARARPPVATGVCVYSVSGGTSAHFADLCDMAGLTLPELSSDTQETLRQWLPEFLRISNPVDSGGQAARDERGRKILETLVADEGVGVLVCVLTGSLPGLEDTLAVNLIWLASRTEKPICVIYGSPIGDEPVYRDVLLPSGLPVFRDARNCLNAIREYLAYHALRDDYRSPFGEAHVVEPAGSQAARRVVTSRPILSEWDSKQVLGHYGIRCCPERLCHSADEAVAAARELGFPVVVKACSPDVLHKSEHGLVITGLDSVDGVREAYLTIEARLASLPGAVTVDGVLVSAQITGGVETAMGIMRDETFGPAVMFGLGGIDLELSHDVVFRVPPFSRQEAERMVREVKAFPLLDGFRGRPRVAVDALVDTIMALQTMAVDLADVIAEVDCNPVIATAEGAVAVDAVVVTRGFRGGGAIIPSAFAPGDGDPRTESLQKVIDWRES
jgi:acyl-CoA synthetase (NDP forming)